MKDGTFIDSNKTQWAIGIPCPSCEGGRTFPCKDCGGSGSKPIVNLPMDLTEVIAGDPELSSD